MRKSLVDYAKRHPEFRTGQVVAAYVDPAMGQLIAYGRITGSDWQDDYGAWVYQIVTHTGATISSPSYCLRAPSPDEQRLLLVQVKGGLQ
jgi:hypothetical protein